jgi:hypothetical protein
MDNSTETSAANQPSSGRPAARFTGSGGLSVAVWKHKSESGVENYSVRMDRSYKDADGNYQSTPYLRDNDLLRAGHLLQQADEWIEQDKGRQRGQASGQGR